MKQAAATSSFGCIIQLIEVRHKGRSMPVRNVFVVSVYILSVCVCVSKCISGVGMWVGGVPYMNM